ncbi:helix-turn-helix domain-containing protein [Salana multivorans]
MDMAELGSRIAAARTMLGRTQGALAASLHLDRAAVSRIESGERKVSVTELLTIAQELGRPLSFFVAPAVPAVVSRRRDGAEAHESNVLLDEELRSFSSDVEGLLEQGVLTGVARGNVHIRTPRSHDEAEHEAARVRRSAAVAPSEALDDLGRFCEGLGLVSFAAHLTSDGPDGACVEVGKGERQLGVAVINGEAPPGRRRMTLAHELAHWLAGDAYDNEVSSDAERMLNSFAIHLLAPRQGVTSIWTSRSHLSERERAVIVAATYRLSWSAAVSQLRNLGHINNETRERLTEHRPSSGEFARLGLSIRPEPAPPYLSPGLVAQVLEAYSRVELTSARTVELLRGTLEEQDLPPLEEPGLELLQEAFLDHEL